MHFLTSLLIISLISTPLSLVSGQTTCGVPQPGSVIDTSIIGGVDSVVNVWPWQLAIETVDGDEWNLICGGVIIDEMWAVTAAQCVYNQSLQLLTIAGMHDRSADIDNDAQIRLIFADQIYIHPDFDYDTLLNDVALINFGIPYDFSTPAIRPICLPTSTDTSYIENPNCFITGWGVTQVDGGTPNILQRAGIDVISNNNCLLFLDRQILPTEVCGFDQVSRTNTPCEGDQGSPLNCLFNGQFYVAGVVSVVNEDCNGRAPHVYSSIPPQIDWIQSVIGSSKHQNY